MKSSIAKATTNCLPTQYVRRLQAESEGGYVASVLEFPGCIAYGHTSEEALKNLDSAAASWMLAVEAAGQHVPPAANFDECSGKIALRISRGLHAHAAERAALEGVSLNQLIAVAVSGYLEKKSVIDDIKEEIHRAIGRSHVEVTVKAISNASTFLLNAQLHAKESSGPKNWLNADGVHSGLYLARKELSPLTI